jgi:hypothetical protein
MTRLSLAIRHDLAKLRTVTPNADLTLTITDHPDPKPVFRGEVFPWRSGDGAGPDNAPRAGARSKVWTREEALQPGDRFTGQDGIDYEVLLRPIPRRAAQVIMCWEVEAVAIDKLYPLRATLSDLGGVEVMTDLPMGIWEGTVSDDTRGAYDNLQAEAPAEFYNALRVPNRELVVGSRAFRIVNALLHRDSPHVRLNVRSTDG